MTTSLFVGEEKLKLFKLIGYEPFKEQKIFHLDESLIKVLRAGRRFGKSISAAMDVMDLVCTPNTRGWIVAPSYALGEKEWRYIIDAIFGGPLFPNSRLKNFIADNGKKFTKSDNALQGHMKLKLWWNYYTNCPPVEIVVKSWDKPHSLLGEEIDWLILSEGSRLPMEIWERNLRAVLLSRNGRLILPSTSSDNSELMCSLFKEGQSKKNKNVASWEFPAYLNPHWAQGEDSKELKKRLKKELSKEAYEEQVLGKVVHYTGRFYKNFDPEVHVKRLNIQSNKIIYRGWDFGFRHPCIIFCQVNQNDQVLWLYSYLGTDLEDEDFIWIGKYLSGVVPFTILPELAKEIIKEEYLSPFFTHEHSPVFEDYCDAAGLQKKRYEGSSIQIMHAHEIYPLYRPEKTQKNENELESVKIIRSLLKKRYNKEPSIYVDENNFLGIEMFRQLSFNKDSRTFKKDGYYEHPHDALRYLVMHIMKHILTNNMFKKHRREYTY